MPRNKDLNFAHQEYKGIKLQLIDRMYGHMKAKRYVLKPAQERFASNQNVWIPNVYLEADGTIRSGVDIDFIFRKSQRQLELAGYLDPIPGIKRRSEHAVITE